jgi:hypothetical protein
MAGLTDPKIKRAKAAEKAYSRGDGGGMCLRVKPTGGKLWRWSYRFEGKEKPMSLGKYPDVPLALARERHAEARKLLATGVDPMAQRKAEKAAEKIAVENSFQSATTRWLEHWQVGKSPRHVDSVRRRMGAEILPCLGARSIAEIEAPELAAMANAIQDRGARDIAKRALEEVGQVFRYGIAKDMQSAARPRRFAPAPF